MGQLLAQKQAAAAAATAAGATASAYAATAQVKAGEAMDQAGVMAASAKQQIIKGVHRAKNITPEEKAKLLSRASTVLTIASIVCPAGRVAKIGGKVVMACVSTPFSCTTSCTHSAQPLFLSRRGTMAKQAGLLDGKDKEEQQLETVAMTMQLKATADAGETMCERQLITSLGRKRGSLGQYDASCAQGLPGRRLRRRLQRHRAGRRPEGRHVPVRRRPQAVRDCLVPVEIFAS